MKQIKKDRKLYIYGTVFNNANTIKKSILSIIPLNPTKIFIVDNFSTDDTIKILENLKKENKCPIVFLQKKCTRGLGRNIAMQMALREAKSNDVLMYMDFDTIIFKRGLKVIKNIIKKIEKNQISIFNGISLAATNKRLPWLNLNYGEDVERLARAKFLGIKITNIRTMLNTVKKMDTKIYYLIMLLH
jgi:glycosyltransferase involved in cell wall biosynthesis